MENLERISKILVMTAAINHLAARLSSLALNMNLVMPTSFTIESMNESMDIALGQLGGTLSVLSNELEARDAFEAIDIQLISNALEILEPVAKVD
jgi:hypothetical protein